MIHFVLFFLDCDQSLFHNFLGNHMKWRQRARHVERSLCRVNSFHASNSCTKMTDWKPHRLLLDYKCGRYTIVNKYNDSIEAAVWQRIFILQPPGGVMQSALSTTSSLCLSPSGGRQYIEWSVSGSKSGSSAVWGLRCRDTFTIMRPCEWQLAVGRRTTMHVRVRCDHCMLVSLSSARHRCTAGGRHQREVQQICYITRGASDAWLRWYF